MHEVVFSGGRCVYKWRGKTAFLNPLAPRYKEVIASASFFYSPITKECKIHFVFVCVLGRNMTNLSLLLEFSWLFSEIM